MFLLSYTLFKVVRMKVERDKLIDIAMLVLLIAAILLLAVILYR
jgi:hypothetical protein